MTSSSNDGRARNPVTRTGRKFRVKYPSRKNCRMIRCESILESDAARVLEFDTGVIRYQEQPERIVFYDDCGREVLYFPDFRATLQDETAVDIEVKPESKLKNPKVARKMEAVVHHYRSANKPFRIWTEETIHREPRFSTLQRLQDAAMPNRIPKTSDEAADAFGESGTCTYVQACERLGGEANVLALLSRNILKMNFDEALKADAMVWLKNFKGESDASVRT